MRSRWVEAVVRESQLLAALEAERPEALPEAVASYVKRLPAPTTPIEHVLLRYFAAHTARNLRRFYALPDIHGDALFARSALSSTSDVIQELFSCLVRDIPSMSTRQDSLAHRASALLQETLHESWTVDAVARCLNCHPRTLERHFKRAYGYGVARFLHLKRLQRALELIVDSDVKLTAIPYLVGFRSRSGFNSAVVRFAGATAGTLRARTQQRHVAIGQIPHARSAEWS